jgi:hypothetical protein
MPGKPFRSKLVPYAEIIVSMRREGATWQTIVDHLSTLGCVSNTGNLVHFFERWSRKPYALGMQPQGEAVLPTKGPEAVVGRVGADPVSAEQRERIAALKTSAPADRLSPADPWDTLCNFDPKKGLTLKPDTPNQNG